MKIFGGMLLLLQPLSAATIQADKIFLGYGDVPSRVYELDVEDLNPLTNQAWEAGFWNAILVNARHATVMGGRATISLPSGESVSQVMMHGGYITGPQYDLDFSDPAAFDASYAAREAALDLAAYEKTWNFQLVSEVTDSGSGATVQVWEGPQPFFDLWNESGTASPYRTIYAKFSFEAVTDSGVIVDDDGGGGYRGLIPEPSSFAMIVLGACFVTVRRHRHR